MKDCEHKWKYQSVVYGLGDQRPGSGAYNMVYYDRYYCENCLVIEDRNKRILGNSYEKPIDGTFPK